MKAQDLAAAISYMIDLAPNSTFLHSWRVALIAGKIAETVAPSVKNETFYAGLFHDIGYIGASEEAHDFLVPSLSVLDAATMNHPERGASFLDTVLDIKDIASIVKTHHEWLDGSGYPEGLSGRQIPFGAQILCLVDSVVLSGAFERGYKLTDCLKALIPYTGNAWSSELWTAFIESLKDAAFYKSILNDNAIGNLMAQYLEECPPPKEITTDKGVESLFSLISMLVDTKDVSTRGHSVRVARLTKTLAESMDMSEDEVQLAYHAGLVHDCGRLGIPGQILNSPGRLNDKEMNLVRKHANLTIQIFNCLPDNESLITLGHSAGHDHERYDGKGYPHHLAGEDIPLISRIICVVDAYDSMVNSNNYRLLSHKGAVVKIKQEAGKQFDPEVVEEFIRLFENNQTGIDAA